MDKDTLTRLFGPGKAPPPPPDKNDDVVAKAAALVDKLEAIIERSSLPTATEDGITAALRAGQLPPSGYEKVGVFPLHVDVYRGPIGDYVVVVPATMSLEQVDEGPEEPSLINPSVTEDADALMGAGFRHIPEEGQSQDDFVREELAKHDPPMAIEQWAITAAKMIHEGAFDLARIATWPVHDRVSELLAKLQSEMVLAQ